MFFAGKQKTARTETSEVAGGAPTRDTFSGKRKHFARGERFGESRILLQETIFGRASGGALRFLSVATATRNNNTT